MKQGAIYHLSALALGLALAGGCKSQKPVGLTSVPAMTPIIKTVSVPTPVPSGGNPGGGLPNGGGLPGGGNPGGTTIVEIPPGNGDFGNNFNGSQVEDRDTFLAQMVHFEYDSSTVRADDMPKVKIVADHLMANPTHALLVEGHCDERGTEDYNLSLGERRAIAVVEALLGYGVPESRIRTTSYGEKIPISEGLTDAAFAQNRRGEFVLLKPSN